MSDRTADGPAGADRSDPNNASPMRAANLEDLRALKVNAVDAKEKGVMMVQRLLQNSDLKLIARTAVVADAMKQLSDNRVRTICKILSAELKYNVLIS